MTLEKELVTKESAAIYHFFDFTRSRVLSVSALEQLAEIPKNTLLNLLTTNRIIPANHIIRLVRVLENFGYQAQCDWDWITSQHNPNRLTTDHQEGVISQHGIYFYYNLPTRKVTLHKGQCSFCNEGSGLQTNLHGEDNGGWRGGFDTYQSAVAEAQAMAQEMGVLPTNCRRCNPQDS
jgi:plasmid maintenance system antidote protein VapI